MLTSNLSEADKYFATAMYNEFQRQKFDGIFTPRYYITCDFIRAGTIKAIDLSCLI